MRPLVVLYATFVLTGIVNTLLGPVLPVLVSWWALDDGRAGLLFAAQFAGSMAGSGLSSVGMTRVGFRRTLVPGVSLMAVGVGALGIGDHTVGMVAIFAFGVGLGLTIPATNLYVTQADPASSASALSLINFAWGVGAVGAPPIVALFQRTNNVRLFLFGVAAALLVMAGALLGISEPARVSDGAGRGTRPEAPARRGAAAWVFGALLFLYVGTETSVGGWVALFAGRLDVLPASLSVATPSLFWAAMLAGRAAVPLVLRRIPEARVLGASLLLGTAGVALLAASRSGTVLAISIVMAGLGLSTVFPLTFAQFTRDLGADAVRRAGSVFVLAGLGGAVLPLLVGFVSNTSGSLSAGLLVPLAGCISILVLRWWRARRPGVAPVRARW